MMTAPPLLLASQSESRRRLLAAAGVPFDSVPSGVDEETAKAALLGEGLNARDIADALAELKALRPSRRVPGVLVLGADQTLERDDGALVDKCATVDEARMVLRALSGRRHQLHSAAVIVRDGVPVWRHIESVAMEMRPLSDGFIDAYLADEWDAVRWCVGCYRIEGPGAQLFAHIRGSLFAVQGLPLLPLLDFLRVQGAMPS